MDKTRKSAEGKPSAELDPATATTTMFNTVEDAVNAIARGEMIIVVDDADRENEGDLVMAASRATAEQIAFMVRHTSGIVCAPITHDGARRLHLNSMVSDTDAPLQTAFTVSVDYQVGLTTGISAEERTATLRALANDNVAGEDFVRPGHVFPLIAKKGGVLTRSGHTEAAVDLANLAGQPAVGVVAELVNDDGSVKRLPALLQFAEEHGLKIVSIADIIAYRQRRERLVERVAEFHVETTIGIAKAIAYSTPFDSVQHLALIFGDIHDGTAVPVRIHRENIIEDVFAQSSTTHQNTISKALKRFQSDGRGILLYLREGSSGVPAWALSESPPATGEEVVQSEATRARDWREVGVGAQILCELGVSSITLLATRRRTYIGLAGFGIELVRTELLGE
jgi:3,4-dihydroxy 2-butanone 4-phosphate synthase/GTP cyclohydrolase II